MKKGNVRGRRASISNNTSRSRSGGETSVSGRKGEGREGKEEKERKENSEGEEIASIIGVGAGAEEKVEEEKD